MIRALGDGTVDKGPYQTIRHGRQGGLQLLADAESLAHDAQQLGVNRACRVGLVVGLVALAVQGQYAGLMQAVQFAHQAALADLRPAGNLVGVETLIRLAIQQAQHLLLGRGE